VSAALAATAASAEAQMLDLCSGLTSMVMAEPGGQLRLAEAALAVCDVTLTETARLLREGRILPAAAGPEAWLDAFGLCFAVLPVTTRVAWTAAAFEWSHRDPCDRHILAAALVHGLPLVTVDPVIAAFAPQVGVEIVW
jgi:PIN domain nuclease of toxin-antitoxin system